MQLPAKLGFFLGITIILGLLYHFPWTNPIKKETKNEDKEIHYREIEYSDLLVCKEPNRLWKESMPLNHLGPSLISSNRDTLVLCPGDSFGDLNNTYVVMKLRDLQMYHQGRLIWSIEGSTPEIDVQANEVFASILQQDGNLAFYHGVEHRSAMQRKLQEVWNRWSSETGFKPEKTELRVQDQQFQILQTFKDGTQRLFYLSETKPKFEEYFGEPKKIGGSKLVKSHADNNPTILKRNEYLGDLDGLHLILQTNCDLDLVNQNRRIWYFRQYWDSQIDCSLIIQEGKWISLLKILSEGEKPDIEIDSIIILHSFKVLESEFILKDDQLTIIQTLEDGSNLIFKSQPGERVGLKLQKESRQIAKNHIAITKDQTPFMIERMDYIGDLDGLHLTLQDNCTFMLVNGQERLWQLNANFFSPCMDCSIELFSKESSSFECLLMSRGNAVLGHPGFGVFLPSGEIKLENNHAIVTIYYEKYNMTTEYYAGPNTLGGWSQRISERSLFLRAQDDSDFYFRDLSHIGDLNGVYLSMYDCNWVLYNQSQVLWESGKKWMPEFNDRPEALQCYTCFKSDGTLATTYTQVIGYDPRSYESLREYGYLWSTINTTKNNDTSKELLTSELSVHDDWLWLTKTFTDGTVQKFMALEGTSEFIAV